MAGRGAGRRDRVLGDSAVVAGHGGGPAGLHRTGLECRGGDPMGEAPSSWRPPATRPDQARQWGMHDDGVVYFPMRRSTARGYWSRPRVHRRRLLVPRRHGQLVRREDGQVAERPRRDHHPDHEGCRPGHAVGGGPPVPYARRITGQTPIRSEAPLLAARAWRERRPRRPLVSADQQLRHGAHPVGDLPGLRGELQRLLPQDRRRRRPAGGYGVNGGGAGYLWHTTDALPRPSLRPNEPTARLAGGDRPVRPPLDPGQRPALGRLKHEGAWVQETRDGQVVVYPGDDQR